MSTTKQNSYDDNISNDINSGADEEDATSGKVQLEYKPTHDVHTYTYEGSARVKSASA